METTTQTRLALAQIIGIEPRVADLIWEAKAFKSMCKTDLECQDAWQGTGDFRGCALRDSLDHVVGWKVSNPRINTNRAYLIVQREILDILDL